MDGGNGGMEFVRIKTVAFIDDGIRDSSSPSSSFQPKKTNRIPNLRY